MVSNFEALKKRSKTKTVKSLVDELNKTLPGNKSSKYEDERCWKPTRDKSGNGLAVVRFLPVSAKDGDKDVPWVRYWDHGFRGPGGWYIEKCRTSLNEQDPACEENSKLWNSGNDALKAIVSVGSGRENPARKRRCHYVTNVLVVSDPGSDKDADGVSLTEGKVFLYEFGMKIFGKITEKIVPDVESEEAEDIFDFWTGRDFKIKIKKVAGFPNYDSSEFLSAAPISVVDENGKRKNLTEAQIKKIWEDEQYSLSELVSPDKFKTTAELQARLDKVLGNSSDDVARSIEDTVSEVTETADDDPDEVEEAEDVEIETADSDVEDDLQGLIDEIDDEE